MKILLGLASFVFLLTACTMGLSNGGRNMMQSGGNTLEDTFADGSYETSLPEQLPFAKETEVVKLENGSNYTLVAEKVRKVIAGKELTVYGYNGMIPGPLFVASKGTNAQITFVNNLGKDTTVHWHGLRGNYLSDGVPGLGQDVVKPGDNFTYNLTFPDEGIYWYHPHVREDAQQDLGLYGNIFVNGLDAIAGPADQEEYLLLDDLLVTSSGIEPFGETHATHAVMGRYGNILLVNGESNLKLNAYTNEVVRLYFTNVANARPFKVQIPGAKIKLIGGDNGAYLEQKFVDELTIAPAERYVVDVIFEHQGTYELRSDNLIEKHLLGTISVSDAPQTAAAKQFSTLKQNIELRKEISDLQKTIDGPVQRQFELDFSLPGMNNMMQAGMMMEHNDDGIEWEDTMPMMSDVTSDRVRWVIREKETGKENANITINAKVGDVEKWRIVNKISSMHPMQHPIHLHGQRFLITAMDGNPVSDLVWKDVVLVPAGHSADIVVQYTNPGEWMLHCHIAEHLETGMFAYVSVADENGTRMPRIGEEMH